MSLHRGASSTFPEPKNAIKTHTHTRNKNVFVPYFVRRKRFPKFGSCSACVCVMRSKGSTVPQQWNWVFILHVFHSSLFLLSFRKQRWWSTLFLHGFLSSRNIDWGLCVNQRTCDGITFFQEINNGYRILSHNMLAAESRGIWNCSPPRLSSFSSEATFIKYELIICWRIAPNSLENSADLLFSMAGLRLVCMQGQKWDHLHSIPGIWCVFNSSFDA